MTGRIFPSISRTGACGRYSGVPSARPNGSPHLVAPYLHFLHGLALQGLASLGGSADSLKACWKDSFDGTQERLSSQD